MVKTIILDGVAFSDLAGFYDEVERKLTRDLDWRIGRNLDAFNDILYGGFGVYQPEEPLRLVWRHSEKCKYDLGYPETVRYMESKVRTCHPSSRIFVEQELALARAGRGQTLYALILEIIADHPTIKLVED